MGAFSPCKSIRQDTHRLCIVHTHVTHKRPDWEQLPGYIHKGRVAQNKRTATASGARRNHRGPLKTEKRGRGPYPGQATHRENSMQPPEKEPTSFLNRRNPESSSHHPLGHAEKNRERPRQNNLLKVRELVKDKSKRKSWVTSIKTTNYKMVKIFQKNELSNHPEWVRAQERTQLLSISFKWDKQWKATGAHNTHSRRDLRERGGEDSPAETGNTARWLGWNTARLPLNPHTSLPPMLHLKREHFACLDYFSLQRAHFRSLFYKQTTTAVKSNRTLV